jgi:glycine/D-amino acid oxidase-like deaminating enzyme
MQIKGISMAIKTDILIIGGGSIGLNCAYHLLKSGRKVTASRQCMMEVRPPVHGGG